jgi:hypothetical protein
MLSFPFVLSCFCVGWFVRTIASWGYLQFLLQIEDDDSPGLDKLLAKLSSAQAKTTNTRDMSQLDFIEKFILGNKRIRNDHGWIDGKRLKSTMPFSINPAMIVANSFVSKDKLFNEI